MTVESKKIVYRVHALQRMFQREITVEEVRRVLDKGETIEEYPDDKPYPSRLVLGFSANRPIHVVVAENVAESEWIVVTVYEPDLSQWNENFRRRII